MRRTGFLRKVFDKKGLQKYVHANGLTVILRTKKGAESVTIGIGSRAGLVHHPLMHLEHHMLFRGTAEKTGIEIKREAVRHGDTFDAFSNLYSTFTFIRVKPRHARHGFQMLADMILNPAMEQEALEKEKQIVVQETKGWSENPKGVLRRLIHQKLYARHPARDVILENPAITLKATQCEIREIHQKFYLAPQHIVIVAVGNFSPVTLLQIIDRRFGSLAKDIEAPFGVLEEEEKEEGRSKKIARTLTHRWHGERAHVIFGFRAPLIHHSDYFPMRLLSAILGEDLDSRLYNELRENTGFVHVRGPLNPASEYDCSLWHGVLQIYAPCAPKDLKAVQSIILRELKKLRQKPVEPEELRRNQDKLITQFLLSLAGTKKYACMLFASEINGMTEAFDKFPRKIRRVSAKDIQRVAKKYCSPLKLVCAILKPTKTPKQK